MLNKTLILLFVFVLFSCGNKKTYITRDYINRIDSASKEKYSSWITFKNLRDNFLKTIDDSITRVAWKEDINYYLDQAQYLDKNIRSCSSILIIQANSVLNV